MPVTRPAAGASSSYMSQAARAGELEKRRSGVEQLFDALAHGELALLAMALEVLRPAPLRGRWPAARGTPRPAPTGARDWA